MKLAEALASRASMRNYIALLEKRMQENALAPVDGTPSENPHKLLEQAEALADQLRSIVRRINKTNSLVELEPGLTLDDALAICKSLNKQKSVYEKFAEAATVSYKSGFLDGDSTGIRAAVNVPDVRKRCNELSRKHRELDARIQAANWTTDLIE